jgi:crossover junction endodeoxyribonuclease RuvC
MRTLGIDPGLATLGWGVVETHGDAAALLGCGVICTAAHTPLPARLLQIHTALGAVLERYQPDAAAIEELFFGKNSTTAMAVGQARGVALLVLAQAGLAVAEYKPTVIKQAVAGDGGADKRQMQSMVRMTLRLAVAPTPDDAADAVAVALCHGYSAPFARQVALGRADR